jgi:methylated-DNA-[protein]-cysteine S-methyltransferase
MPEQSFAIFETTIGCCAIVWIARGVTGVQLPEKDAAATHARVQRRFAGAREAAPSPEIQTVIDGIVTLLRGDHHDFGDVALDFGALPAFNLRVYDIARTIPAGQTMTYGEIAERLGDKLLARDVGTALGQNPIPLIMPCHRVLAAGGKTGGFSASGGVVTKLRILTIEGAEPGGPTLFERLPLVASRRRR